MPAGPALAREDEVWAVFAFLRRLPRLDEAAYESLAFGEAGAPQPIASSAAQGAPGAATPAAAGCLRCHGEEGAGSRSEEHTSELQSIMRISYAVFCLKKTKPENDAHHIHTLLTHLQSRP